MAETGSEHRYQVFISYSHKDKAWAEWLEQKLEGYRVPRGLEGKSQLFEVLPKRIKPVFRDRSTAAAGSALSDNLKNWLDQSANLIVICSPNSAHPNPITGRNLINEEIAHFRETGRGHRVFALVVDGEPGAGDDTEAFPPQFQEVPPLAADAREHGDGKDLAFMKLAAGILGVELIDLQDKQNAEDKERARKFRIATAAFALLFIFASIGFWSSGSNYWNAIYEKSSTISAIAMIENDRENYEDSLIISLNSTFAGSGQFLPYNPHVYSQLYRSLLGLRLIRSIRAEGQHHPIDVSIDGNFLLTEQGNTISLWSIQDATLISSYVYTASNRGDLPARFIANDDYFAILNEGNFIDIRQSDTGSRICRHALPEGTNDIIMLRDAPAIIVHHDESEIAIFTIECDFNSTQLGRNVDQITVADWSRDGRYVATGHLDGSAVVWDFETGQVRRAFPGSRDACSPVEGVCGATAVSFSSDNRFILIASGAWSVSVWSLETGEQVQQFPMESPILDAEFAPSGYQALVSSIRDTALWEVGAAQPLRMFNGVNRFQWANDESIFATNADQGVTIRTVENLRAEVSINSASSSQSNLGLFQFGSNTFINSGEGGGIQFWRTNHQEVSISHNIIELPSGVEPIELTNQGLVVLRLDDAKELLYDFEARQLTSFHRSSGSEQVEANSSIRSVYRSGDFENDPQTEFQRDQIAFRRSSSSTFVVHTDVDGATQTLAEYRCCKDITAYVHVPNRWALVIAADFADGPPGPYTRNLETSFKIFDLQTGDMWASIQLDNYDWRGLGPQSIYNVSQDMRRILFLGAGNEISTIDLSVLSLNEIEAVEQSCSYAYANQLMMRSSLAVSYFGGASSDVLRPCDRVGPLDPSYYTRAVSRWFGGDAEEASP